MLPPGPLVPGPLPGRGQPAVPGGALVGAGDFASSVPVLPCATDVPPSKAPPGPAGGVSGWGGNLGGPSAAPAPVLGPGPPSPPPPPPPPPPPSVPPPL
eukprot:13567937-Alexandrium_andersonii.AAC.1